jgi:hypothetical protein
MKKRSTYTQPLLCPLSAEEFETKSKGLADLCKEINRAKDLAREEAKANKESIDKMEAQRTLLSTMVRDKAEARDVECEDRYSYTTREVHSIRLDTGEIIGTRAMELSEYQSEMDLSANVVSIGKKTAGA